MIGQLVLATTLLQAEARPRPLYDVVDVDMATLHPGSETALLIPAERRYRLRLLSRVPRDRYVLTTTYPGSDRSRERVVEPAASSDLDDYRNCPGADPVVESLWAATDEQDVARLTGPGGPVGRLESQRVCSRSLFTRLSLATMIDVVGQDDADPGARGELVVTRDGGPSWRFRLRVAEPERLWAHMNEEHAIIARVVRGIVETLLFAAGDSRMGEDLEIRVGFGAIDTERRVALEVSGRAPLASTVTLTESIWAPSTYALLSDAVVEWLALDVGAPDPSDATPRASGLLERLTRPTALVIAGESAALSRDLALRPLDPDLHERAALVVASFALREQAGDYSDLRPLLSRIAAHLVVSRFTSGGPHTQVGRVAGIVLDVLSGRQVPALEAIRDLEAEGSTAGRAWARALRRRITEDWRDEPSGGSTPLERRESYAATARTLGGARALLSVDEDDRDYILDRIRISYTGRPSVQEVNLFASVAVDLELQEASAVHAVLRGTPIEPSAVRDELGPPLEGFMLRGPSGTPIPAVLGWPLWAGSYSRHVAQALVIVDRYWSRTVSKEGEMEWEELAYVNRRNWLFPLFTVELASRRLLSARADYNTWFQRRIRACEQLAWLWEREPERISRSQWSLLRKNCVPTRSSNPPQLAVWFGHGTPFGTAYEAALRALGPGEGLAGLQRRRALAPFDAGLARWELRYGNRKVVLDANGARRIAGPRLDYDLSVLERAIDMVDDDQSRLELRRQKCELDGDSCFDLGTLWVGMERIEEAVAAYEDGYERGLVRAHVANEVRWLSQHHLDTGKTERALEITTHAAAIASARGLYTHGRLLEALGRYGEAEESYRAIQELYGNRSHLQRFHLRVSRRNPSGPYAELGAEARAAFRCDAAEPYAIDPRFYSRGYSVGSISPRFERLGLREGDLIVAVDGLALKSTDHFVCAIESSDDPMVHGTLFETDAPLRRPHPDFRYDNFDVRAAPKQPPS